MLENLVDNHATGTCISKLMIPPQEERGVEEAENLCEEKRIKAQGGEGQPFPQVMGVTSIAGLIEQTVPVECVCL